MSDWIAIRILQRRCQLRRESLHANKCLREVTFYPNAGCARLLYQCRIVSLSDRELTRHMFADRLRRSPNHTRDIIGDRMSVRACIGFGILLSLICASLASAQTAGT